MLHVSIDPSILKKKKIRSTKQQTTNPPNENKQTNKQTKTETNRHKRQTTDEAEQSKERKERKEKLTNNECECSLQRERAAHAQQCFISYLIWVWSRTWRAYLYYSNRCDPILDLLLSSSLQAAASFS